MRNWRATATSPLRRPRLPPPPTRSRHQPRRARVRVLPSPTPGHRRGPPAPLAVPRLRHPWCPGPRPAWRRRWRYARATAHLAPRLHLAPATTCPPQPPRPLEPEALARPHLPPLLAVASWRALPPRPALRFSRRHLCPHQPGLRLPPQHTLPPATRHGRAIPQPPGVAWRGHRVAARQPEPLAPASACEAGCRPGPGLLAPLPGHGAEGAGPPPRARAHGPHATHHARPGERVSAWSTPGARPPPHAWRDAGDACPPWRRHPPQGAGSRAPATSAAPSSRHAPPQSHAPRGRLRGDQSGGWPGPPRGARAPGEALRSSVRAAADHRPWCHRASRALHAVHRRATTQAQWRALRYTARCGALGSAWAFSSLGLRCPVLEKKRDEQRPAYGINPQA